MNSSNNRPSPQPISIIAVVSEFKNWCEKICETYDKYHVEICGIGIETVGCGAPTLMGVFCK